MVAFFFVFCVCFFFPFSLAFEGAIPMKQIHLAATGVETEMHVSWVTEGAIGAPVVRWGSQSGVYPNFAAGVSIVYDNITDVIHRAVMVGLIDKVNRKVFYVVGDQDTESWSSENSFLSPPVSSGSAAHDQPLTILAYADMGTWVNSSVVVASIAAASMKNYPYDICLHPGDISYAGIEAPTNLTEQTAIWDSFFGLIEPISQSMPYMVAAGNHDIDDPSHGNDDGTECGVAYVHRFKMPMQNESETDDSCEGSYYTRVWYSYNYGPVHFTVMSTEHDYTPGSEQYEFLMEDLKAANANREQQPWIFFYGHKPAYCSHSFPECEPTASDNPMHYIDPLLYEYKVDLALWGHIHAYERTYPVFNNTLMSTSYHNPPAPVHILLGCAGAGYLGPWATQPDWSAYREQLYGFTNIQVMNASALFFQYFGYNNDVVHDSFWLTKD